MSSNSVEFLCQGRKVRFSLDTNQADLVEAPQPSVPEPTPNPPSVKPKKARPSVNELETLLPNNLRGNHLDPAWDLSADDVKKMTDLYGTLSVGPEDVAVAAEVGHLKRDWYPKAYHTFVGLFGPAEGARMAALSSTFSPGTGPRNELYNAIKVMNAYNNRLRGTEREHDPQAIRQMILDLRKRGEFASMVYDTGMALPASRVLSVPHAMWDDPKAALHEAFKHGKGLKTSTYAAQKTLNKLTDSTNDRWVGYLLGIEPKQFASKHGYRLATTINKKATEILNSMPEYQDRPWQTHETQAASWSATRMLRDLSVRSKDPWAVLMHMTHGDVAETEDFLSLVATDAKLQALLRDSGHSRAVAKLVKLHQELRPSETARGQRAAFSPKGITDRLQAFPGLVTAVQKHPDIQDKVPFARRDQLTWQGPPDAAHWLGFTPNLSDDLPFDESYRRLQSSNQAAGKKITEDVLKGQGVTSHKTYDVVGDWSGATEPGFLQALEPPPDPQKTKYLAAWYGLLLHQKAILVFHADPKGPDRTYSIVVPQSNAEDLRKSLDTFDLPDRAIVPTQHGHTVVIYDQAGSKRPNVLQFAGHHNANVRETRGHGEYVGASSNNDARVKSRKTYRDIIRAYESQHGPQGGTGSTSNGPDVPGTPQHDQGPGPVKFARKKADQGVAEVHRSYLKQAGLPQAAPPDYAPVDQARAGKIAQAYEDMSHDPHSPQVQAAYQALKDETRTQYNQLAARSAPAGGYVVRGVYYKGGEKIPAKMSMRQRFEKFYGPETAKRVWKEKTPASSS